MQVNTVVLVRIFSGINFAAGPGPPECEMAGSPVIGTKNNCIFKKVQYPQASMICHSGKFLLQDFLDERQHWKQGRMARAVFCIESLIDASAPARTSASKM